MEEKQNTIYFTDNPDTGIVHPDFIQDDELTGTVSGVIVVLFISMALLVVIAAIFLSIYFK